MIHPNNNNEEEDYEIENERAQMHRFDYLLGMPNAEFHATHNFFVQLYQNEVFNAGYALADIDERLNRGHAHEDMFIILYELANSTTIFDMLTVANNLISLEYRGNMDTIFRMCHQAFLGH